MVASAHNKRHDFATLASCLSHVEEGGGSVYQDKATIVTTTIANEKIAM
jgi:hypothetical protein